MSDNAIGFTPIQRIAYDTIEEIIGMKRDMVEPCMAHINEIRDSLNIELMEALRDLCRKGILGYHIDINKNLMFSIKNNE